MKGEGKPGMLIMALKAKDKAGGDVPMKGGKGMGMKGGEGEEDMHGAMARDMMAAMKAGDEKKLARVLRAMHDMME